MSTSPSRRFDIALSFPGEHREVVEKVANILADKFTQERVLYDNYHDAEFAAPDLDIYLPSLYRNDSELLVIFLCPEYPTKRWCRLEWRQIRQLIATVESRRIMFLSFGKLGDIPDLGIVEGDGKLDVTGKSPELIADKILKRLHLNKGATPPPPATPLTGITNPSPLVHKPSNLPGGYLGQLFLGRDEFLETIRQSLTGTGHATAITQKAVATGISGLGGIGKTHAAVEYANHYRAEYTALLFATADTPEKLHSSLAALCEVLRLDENGTLPPDEPSRMWVALDWLATHPGWLLIIDNVDDESAALALTNLLGKLSAGHLLVTSRLHNWSRQVKKLDLSVLTPEASTQLLLDLTAEGRLFADDDETQAGELAGLLDGLPLAIHQAAGFINEQTLTFAGYIARFHEEAADLLNWFSKLSIPYAGPDTQKGRIEDLAPRPVLVTWKTSFAKLSKAERFWLLVFSLFAPEPIPKFLLEPTDKASNEEKAVLRAADTAISHAAKYSLLTRSRNEPVFKIHRLVQQITRLQASDDDCFRALENAVTLIAIASPGSPSDVRNWSKWNPLQQHAVSICSHLGAGSPPHNLSWLANSLSTLLKRKGLFNECETFSRSALKIDRAIYGDDHPNVATSLNNLALLLQDTNRFSEAEPLLRDALRIDRAAYDDNHPEVSIDLNNLAVLLQATNRFSEAEPLVRDSLRIDLAAYGDNHPKVAVRLNNLAQLLKSTNRLSEAEPLMRDALRIERAAYGNDHPDVARDLNNLAALLHDTGRLSEAEPLMRDALRINRAVYGDNHPDVASILSNLALLLKDTNRLSEAEPLMLDALRIDRATYGNDHPHVAIDLNNLSQLLKATDRLSEAEPLMRDALRIDRAAYGGDHPSVAIRLNNLALLLKATNRQSEAEPLYRDALLILHNSLGPAHPYTAGTARNLKILLMEMNKPTKDQQNS